MADTVELPPLNMGQVAKIMQMHLDDHYVAQWLRSQTPDKIRGLQSLLSYDRIELTLTFLPDRASKASRHNG